MCMLFFMGLSMVPLVAHRCRFLLLDKHSNHSTKLFQSILGIFEKRDEQLETLNKKLIEISYLEGLALYKY